MKKLICLFLLMVMIVSVASCGKGESADSVTSDETPAQSTEAKAEQTDVPGSSAAVGEENETTMSVAPSETTISSSTAKPAATTNPDVKTSAPVVTSTQSNNAESEQAVGSAMADNKNDPIESAVPTVTQSLTAKPTATAKPTSTVKPAATAKPTVTVKPTTTIKPTATVKPVNRGTLTISSVYAFVGYPASGIYPEFSIPQMAEKLTYTFEGDGIKIDPVKNTVTALKKGSYTVVASSENFKTSFTVYAKEVDKNKTITSINSVSKGEKKYNPQKFSSQAADRLSQWEKDGVDGKTTLFIGDSFFDIYFWSDFYTKYYGEKDALLLGIGSTTTYDWEVWADEWLGKTSPKNIVINIGTNNVYDDGDSASDTVLALQRLFIVLHNKFPDAQIYWYGISQRDDNSAKIRTVSSVNKTMKAWCGLCDYVTYVDATSKLTANDLRDGVHPKLEKYSIFTDALSETDIVIESKSSD